MASGLPDYLKIVRPRFGGALRSYDLRNVTGSAPTTLISVVGKGMLYGGLLSLDEAASQKNSIVRLKVDGQYISGPSFYFLNYYGTTIAGAYPVVLTKYDETNFVYGVTFSYGVTFETELALVYQEEHGGTPLIYSEMIYALL